MSKYIKEKLVNTLLQQIGNIETPDTTEVAVLTKDSSGDVLFATGITVPTNGETGFAKGCEFHDTDVAGGTSGSYVNIGTNTSCEFVVGGSDLAAATISGELTLGPASTIVQTDAARVTAATINYFLASTSATTGTLNTVRARAEGEAVGPSTGEIRAVYGQGIAKDGLFAGHVTGIFGNAIAKGTSTSVTLRAGFFEAESEGTPTEIATMYGTHTRVKTSVVPTTAFACALLETEKFGSGVPVDSFLSFKTTTWTGGETIATSMIDMDDVTGTATDLLKVGANLTVTNLINIAATANVASLVEFDAGATDKAIEANTATLTLAPTAYAVRVTVGGTPYYIPAFDNKTWT